jgi:DNA-binding beta-propeller fold protein YncE
VVPSADKFFGPAEKALINALPFAIVPSNCQRLLTKPRIQFIFAGHFPEAPSPLTQYSRRLLLVLCSFALLGSPIYRAQNTAEDYLAYVVCESADKIERVRFHPGDAPSLKLDHEIHIGLMPADINGPHGIAISPDRQFLYVSVAHGRPYGSVWKLNTGTDEVIRFAPLGLFPATTDVSKSGRFIYVANANFHGDMVPSSISVVTTDEMVEVKRITTCTMPHGSRLNPQGTKHYSVCMMDDMLAEIDTNTLQLSRYFMLSAGKEMGMTGVPQGHDAKHLMNATCVPTWAQPSNDGNVIYVACNKSSEIVAVDADKWTMIKRFPAGTGAYNLAMTKDGRLVATNKRGQSVSFFDPQTGKELARTPTKRKVVHGAVVTPDNRYVFITEEGVGAEPGTVEVMDLGTYKSLASLDIGEQAAGVDFWKMAPSQP